jgi:hypothetical protein
MRLLGQFPEWRIGCNPSESVGSATYYASGQRQTLCPVTKKGRELAWAELASDTAVGTTQLATAAAPDFLQIFQFPKFILGVAWQII